MAEELEQGLRGGGVSARGERVGGGGLQRFRRRTDEEEWERESDAEWAASGDDSDEEGKDVNYKPVYAWWMARGLVPPQNMRGRSRHVASLKVPTPPPLLCSSPCSTSLSVPTANLLRVTWRDDLHTCSAFFPFSTIRPCPGSTCGCVPHIETHSRLMRFNTDVMRIC